MADFALLFNLGWIVSVLMAAISAISSAVTLLLIHDMNRWNTYMLLIFHLTACQLLSDIAFFFEPVDAENTIYFQCQLFFYTLGAVSVTLWTNVISCSLFSVVIFQKNLPIKRFFNVLRVCIMIPGLVLGILFAIFVQTGYNAIISVVIWLLILSIIFNVAVHISVSYALHQMCLEYLSDDISTIGSESRDETRPSGSSVRPVQMTDMRASYPEKINVYEPILELARRLKYYPIVQIVAILGQVWYFLEYNLKYFGPEHNETLKLVAWYMYSILTPSTGLGYFIVFLTVQPFAYNHLQTRLYWLFGSQSNERTLSIQSDTSYREPSSTTMRVTETDIQQRYSIDSSVSSSHNPTGASVFTNNTLSTMDEDGLMRRIRELHRINAAAHHATDSNIGTTIGTITRTGSASVTASSIGRLSSNSAYYNRDSNSEGNPMHTEP